MEEGRMKEKKTGQQEATGVSRRAVLKGSAAAAAGAATVGFPTIAKAQGPITMRWQSTWPQRDIFHEYALDYAKKVNDMTGGDLKIEVLPAGAAAPALAPPPPAAHGGRGAGHRPPRVPYRHTTRPPAPGPG